MNQRWFLSLHALGRCREMKLDRREVTAVLETPEITRPSSGGRVVAAGGRLAVVYEAQRRVVVTVLWRTPVQFERRPWSLVA